MVIRSNRPYSEISQRIDDVKRTTATSFREIALASGFDLKKDLRYQNLSGLSFAGEDLRGIDFTGANLIGCDFRNAQIATARFDRARLGNMAVLGANRITLKEAVDWGEHVGTWRQAEPYPESGTHLAEGDMFFDGPRLPMMVMLPPLWPTQSGRHAVSVEPVSKLERVLSNQSSSLLWSDYRDMARTNIGDDTSFSWEDAKAYVEDARRYANGNFQLPLRFTLGDVVKLQGWVPQLSWVSLDDIWSGSGREYHDFGFMNVSGIDPIGRGRVVLFQVLDRRRAGT